jgi:hypothetical protein
MGSSDNNVSFPPIGPKTRQLLNQAFKEIDFSPGQIGQQAAGVGGQGFDLQGDILGGIHGSDITGAFRQGLGGLGVGINQGYLKQSLPNIEQLNAQFQPSTNYQFQQGAADLREQAALTGNLSSSGAFNNLSDYRAQLDNSQRGQVAGIYGNALAAGIPSDIASRTQLTGQALGLPGQISTGLAGPAAGQGLSAEQFQQQFPVQGFGTIMGANNGQSPIVQGGGMNPYGQALVGLGSAYLGSGAWAGKCWVAEAIYGPDDPRTWAARFYVNLLAPWWIGAIYEKVGRQVATVTRRSAILKWLLRPLFDWMVRRTVKVLA